MHVQLCASIKLTASFTVTILNSVSADAGSQDQLQEQGAHLVHCQIAAGRQIMTDIGGQLRQIGVHRFEGRPRRVVC